MQNFLGSFMRDVLASVNNNNTSSQVQESAGNVEKQMQYQKLYRTLLHDITLSSSIENVTDLLVFRLGTMRKAKDVIIRMFQNMVQTSLSRWALASSGGIVEIRQ